MRGFILIFITLSQLFITVQMNRIPTNSISASAETEDSDSGSIEIPVRPKNRNSGRQNVADTTHGTGILKLLGKILEILHRGVQNDMRRARDESRNALTEFNNIINV